MTMRKIVLTTHWSPEEVYDILQLLTELHETIANNYTAELNTFYQQIEKQQACLDFDDDIIPF